MFLQMPMIFVLIWMHVTHHLQHRLQIQNHPNTGLQPVALVTSKPCSKDSTQENLPVLMISLIWYRCGRCVSTCPECHECDANQG